jgi:hypothetical protein
MAIDMHDLAGAGGHREGQGASDHVIATNVAPKHRGILECARQSRLIRDSETDASRAEDAAWEAASAEAIARDEG